MEYIIRIVLFLKLRSFLAFSSKYLSYGIKSSAEFKATKEGSFAHPSERPPHRVVWMQTNRLWLERHSPLEVG